MINLTNDAKQDQMIVAKDISNPTEEELNAIYEEIENKISLIGEYTQIDADDVEFTIRHCEYLKKGLDILKNMEKLMKRFNINDKEYERIHNTITELTNEVESMFTYTKKLKSIGRKLERTKLVIEETSTSD